MIEGTWMWIQICWQKCRSTPPCCNHKGFWGLISGKSILYSYFTVRPNFFITWKIENMELFDNWTILVTKQFFNFCTVSVRGCWGQPRLLFSKLVLITNMSTSQNFKTTFKYVLTCIFLSLRAELLLIFAMKYPGSRKKTITTKLGTE